MRDEELTRDGSSVLAANGGRAVSVAALLSFLVGCAALAVAIACGGTTGAAPAASTAPASGPAYDPLAYALARSGSVENLEASIPPMCYTKTAGFSNPCWTCHVQPVLPNQREDWTLQEEYAFSDVGLENHWRNLFLDRSAEVARIPDAEILAWIRGDNYGPLQTALAERPSFPGWVPDLDIERGFDHEGFALDGTGWRALRYKPFLGTFWPTNGSSDDVMVRLPRSFRVRADGTESREVYRVNLSILEAALAADPRASLHDLDRAVEPLDEAVAGIDLDANGGVGGVVTRIRGLPERYVGGAAGVAVVRHLHPAGVEYLHTVRYVDPDAPDLLGRRMKEVRYSVKRAFLDAWAINRAYEKDEAERMEGRPPVHPGGAEVGLQNAFGWRLQAWIEDAEGRLRLQSDEETKACMGCHGGLGMTVDATFTLPRKVPGADGWRHQTLAGMHDVPQAGHGKPEVLTYFERVQGGDEFRANDEVLERFFPAGVLDESAVRRAAPGGDRDLAWLLAPSRARALRMAKAYRVLVATQSFSRGRDPLVSPAMNVHPKIENGDTDLRKTGRVFLDGTLHLDWE